MHNAINTPGMTMRYPATRWQDACPTGSGIVGAMVYGNICNDTILLNHDALYYPRQAPANLDVSHLLPEVRRLIQAGRYREAAAVMPDAYAKQVGEDTGSTSKGSDPYQPFCALGLQMSTDGPFRGYRRGVDFDTGRAWVAWQDNAGTFTRELFVSRANDAVYLRITGSEPGSVNCAVGLKQVANEQRGQKLTHTSGLPGDIEVTCTSRASQTNRALTFVGEYPDGSSFGAVGHLVATGGTVSEREEKLRVQGADQVVLQIRLFVGEDPADALPRLTSACIDEQATFDQLFEQHSELHRDLFNRVQLRLGAGGDDARPCNEQLLMTAYEGDVPPRLLQSMFEFGRYLLICSSRPGGWPANLQGLWNGDYAPAWNSDIHTDENIQMNYWQALAGHMPETVLPLFDYFERHRDAFADNARNLFNCRGIFVPIALTTDGHDVPRTWSNWTAAAGWIAQHFYDYYLFTGDLEFLRHRAVPWLREIALFYEDFLIEGEDGRLLFAPSLSPENRPANSNSLLCMNATMDVAVCREVLSHLCDACQTLGIEAEGVARWRGMIERLPAYEVNEDGAIREWLHPAFEDNYHHRHQSHIYPLFPGFEITPESDPAMFQACRIAVEKRLVIGLTSQTGWSMAHMANIYARLGMGDRAVECLEILSRSSLGPNLLTYHNDWRQMGLSLGWGGNPPFQIDANFGIAAAVQEMLVFSRPGEIRLLPALPSSWPDGQVKGLACRGGFAVDVHWQAGRLSRATVRRTAPGSGEVTLGYGDQKRDVQINHGEEKPLSADDFGV